ncbi:DUF3857 domain-containing protein [Chitinophaga lutea]
MKKIIAIFICMFLLVLGMMAQEKKPESWDVKAEIKYKKRLEEVKKEVWAINQEAFAVRTVPAEYKAESAVILAKHQELTTPDKDRELHKTVRMLVKINDKAALEEYSEFSFNQYYAWYGVLDPFGKTTEATYMGARVYKADGTMKEIYSDEAVVTDINKYRYKARKLAIPGLQTGDFIDYFIRTEKLINHGNAYTEELFLLGDEAPVMQYSVHVGAWEEVFALEYRAMNGAPNFKQKLNGRMMELDMLVKNLPPQPIKLWMNPWKQLPMVRLHLRIGGRREGVGRRKEGTIYSNPNAMKTRDEAVAEVVAMRNLTSKFTLPFLDDVWDEVKKYKKKNKDATNEELAGYIYYLVRFMGLYRPSPTDGIVVDRQRNHAKLSEKNFLRYVNYMLVKNDIDAEFVMVTERFGPGQQEVFETDDYHVMLKLPGKTGMYMSADGMFSNARYIPSEYEGQTAPLIPGGPKGEAIRGQVDVPASAAEENRQLERLSISFAAADPQQLQLDRLTTTTGHYKAAMQRQLLLFEDYYEAERKALGISRTFMAEISDRRGSGTLVSEYRTAFSNARKDLKDHFESEIREQFDVAPVNLTHYKVQKMGLRHTDPEMIYATKFGLDGFVKKAGSNYIVDAGRLIGSQLSVKTSQRERKADVYMPFARSLEYQMEFIVPAGYTLEGADKLVRNVDNECGSFIVTTKMNGDKLVVDVKKVYKVAFAQAAKWPMLLQMVDAAEEFRQQKLLLRKA